MIWMTKNCLLYHGLQMFFLIYHYFKNILKKQPFYHCRRFIQPESWQGVRSFCWGREKKREYEITGLRFSVPKYLSYPFSLSLWFSAGLNWFDFMPRANILALSKLNSGPFHLSSSTHFPSSFGPFSPLLAASMCGPSCLSCSRWPN